MINTVLSLLILSVGSFSFNFFGFIYGICFARVGRWLPNDVATMLRVVFGVVVYFKQI